MNDTAKSPAGTSGPPADEDLNGNGTLSLGGRLAVLLLVVIAVSVIWVTNRLLSERFTDHTRNQAIVRQTLYSGNLLSELQRNSIVPLLLSRDPSLIGALASEDFSQTSRRLISYIEEIGAASLILLDSDGRVVAATNRNLIGTSYRQARYFVNALRSNDTVFETVENAVGGFEFIYSRRIENSGKLAGVIVVEVDLHKFETSWAGISGAVFVADSSGRIILSTEPRWRGKSEKEALAIRSAPSAIERAIQATSDWSATPPDAYLSGEAVMRMENRIAFRGWRITTFTTYTSVRERVNAVLSLEIMGFAILLALTFYLTTRRAIFRAGKFARESASLRQLNAALQREITSRERAEKHLKVAEQTLAQSSKLAALGEMSAAVSHELNQPLAAMKTYLAGAKLLLQRRRPDEALSSFQRIDDLIERMGAITRQLKSYARKGADALQPMDVRKSVSSALAMMEPQLKLRDVEVVCNLPREPVLILGDQLRLEQVLINLMRNALDATKGEDDPIMEILVVSGDSASIQVRDNGDGIEDFDALFEPFYTTKSPGDGVGLGLAISSGIIADLGGRLTARSAPAKGAIFEVSLPILESNTEAAE
ncbi:sensor histidine kinase [Candidatus Halocynthiibacter alkanivorans]|uniref:sensor histidine kinase n=1 Tax=Candidatus Halocynthiibacter alkanivorans TaxID=2267619 RepID=UPI000DF2E4F8|nr:ATP-binding protein [Candidatus Halocynthiibacter alkanivorans]